MTIWKNAFGSLQKIGKALMLPVSVLPVAGILLGVGSAHFTWLPAIVSDVMAQSGGAIFGNLPLIFAIGVALGFTAQRRRRGAGRGSRLRRPARHDGRRRRPPRLRAKDDHGDSLDRNGGLRRHSDRRNRRVAVQPLFPAAVAAVSWILFRETVGADPGGAGSGGGRRRPQPGLAADRPWHRQLFPLGSVGQSRGGVCDLRDRRTVTHSLRAASHLERAVLFRGRTVPGPGERQDPARRSLPLRRRRPHRRESGRRVPLQDVGTAGCRHRHVAQRQARKPREGRWDHDLRGAHVFSNRHHRANRVFVPVRRAAAVRDPRGTRRGGVLRLYRARHPSRHDVLAWADRLRRVVPAVDTRPLVPLARPDLGCRLLRHLSDDDPAV